MNQPQKYSHPGIGVHDHPVIAPPHYCFYLFRFGQPQTLPLLSFVSGEGTTSRSINYQLPFNLFMKPLEVIADSIYQIIECGLTSLPQRLTETRPRNDLRHRGRSIIASARHSCLEEAESDRSGSGRILGRTWAVATVFVLVGEEPNT